MVLLYKLIVLYRWRSRFNIFDRLCILWFIILWWLGLDNDCWLSNRSIILLLLNLMSFNILHWLFYILWLFFIISWLLSHILLIWLLSGNDSLWWCWMHWLHYYLLRRCWMHWLWSHCVSDRLHHNTLSVGYSWWSALNHWYSLLNSLHWWLISWSSCLLDWNSRLMLLNNLSLWWDLWSWGLNLSHWLHICCLLSINLLWLLSQMLLLR